MKHSTFGTIKRAYLGDIDRVALEAALKEETDPLLHDVIHRILHLETSKTQINWDMKPFTVNFHAASPRERMEEVFLTFILRIISVIKYETYERIFLKPESLTVIQPWLMLLKRVIYSATILLYDVTWTTEKLFELDAVVTKLVQNARPHLLREFFTESLGISFVQPYPVQAETMFSKLALLGTHQFGSSFWRMLHWMAEAVDDKTRMDSKVLHAKQVWRNLVLYPLYRTLLCGVCMSHMKYLVHESKHEMQDPAAHYSMLWYNIHNKVTEMRNKMSTVPLFPSWDAKFQESMYEKDAQFMREALPQEKYELPNEEN